MAEAPDQDQKTEDATPRRREEARAKGQVAMSQEFMAALMLIAGFGALLVAGGHVSRTAGSMAIQAIESLPTIGTDDWSAPSVAALLEATAMPTLETTALCFAPIALLGLLVGYGQIGVRVTPKAVKPDLSKLDMTKGFKKLFSRRAFVRTAMALAKIILISSAVVAVAYTQIDEIIRLGNSELGPMLAGMGKIALRCTAAALVVILILSVIDVFFQRAQHERELRMSKQEVKEEHRTTEGDPQVKARVRRLQREMATARMMDDVPTATVVVTNPTHYAVALRYDREPGAGAPSAPVVVAKGLDHLALRIREIAAENDVVCYEDPPLARALYAQVQVGDEIPEDFYAAMATVLSYVYRLQDERVSA